MRGLRIAFTTSAVMCLVAAAASWLRGGRYVHEDVAPTADVREPDEPLVLPADDPSDARR
jgi:hypothetical protein